MPRAAKRDWEGYILEMEGVDIAYGEVRRVVAYSSWQIGEDIL